MCLESDAHRDHGVMTIAQAAGFVAAQQEGLYSSAAELTSKLAASIASAKDEATRVRAAEAAAAAEVEAVFTALAACVNTRKAAALAELQGVAQDRAGLLGAQQAGLEAAHASLSDLAGDAREFTDANDDARSLVSAVQLAEAVKQLTGASDAQGDGGGGGPKLGGLEAFADFEFAADAGKLVAGLECLLESTMIKAEGVAPRHCTMEGAVLDQHVHEGVAQCATVAGGEPVSFAIV